jgi:hypothetical protein
MRRSRSGCPVRLRSARESDLRTSSLPCGSHYGVELRCGVSFKCRWAFAFASPFLRRRASRRSPVVVAFDVIASYMQRRTSRNTRKPESAACPQETCVLHDDSHKITQYTAACSCVAIAKCGTTLRRRRTHAQTRRSRTSCPVRLRSARESDLRASSLPFSSHYGVELRSGASFDVSSGLHRPKRDLRTASFSQLARQRCR